MLLTVCFVVQLRCPVDNGLSFAIGICDTLSVSEFGIEFQLRFLEWNSSFAFWNGFIPLGGRLLRLILLCLLAAALRPMLSTTARRRQSSNPLLACGRGSIASVRAVPDIAYDMSTAQAFHVDGRHFLAFVRAAVDFKNSEVVGNVSAFVKQMRRPHVCVTIAGIGIHIGGRGVCSPEAKAKAKAKAKA